MHALLKAAAVAAVFSRSEAVQRQRQTPPPVSCQHLDANDAAALSSANWLDRDESEPRSLAVAVRCNLPTCLCLRVCVRARVCCMFWCLCSHLLPDRALLLITETHSEITQSDWRKAAQTSLLYAAEHNVCFQPRSHIFTHHLLRSIWKDSKSLTFITLVYKGLNLCAEAEDKWTPEGGEPARGSRVWDVSLEVQGFIYFSGFILNLVHLTIWKDNAGLRVFKNAQARDVEG